MGEGVLSKTNMVLGVISFAPNVRCLNSMDNELRALKDVHLMAKDLDTQSLYIEPDALVLRNLMYNAPAYHIRSF